MAKRVVKDIKKFTVKRENWLRGEKNDSRLLRYDDNKMCCLGFYARACGIPKKYILDESTPNESYGNLLNMNTRWDSFLISKSDVCTDPFLISVDDAYTDDSKSANELMKINDDDTISDKTRENRLKKLFLKNGIKVNFVK